MKTKPKFRAWYKPDFKTKDGALKFVQIKNNDGLWFKYSNDLKYSFDIPFMDSDWIVEQYTGLKDKNKREIYEGDIISYTPFNYSKYKNTIRVIPRMVNSFHWFEDFSDMLNLRGKCDICVIGNIHQNPELLKQLAFHIKKFKQDKSPYIVKPCSLEQFSDVYKFSKAIIKRIKSLKKKK